MKAVPQGPGGDFSPALKMAAHEIKAVLEKYDCAAIVVLQVPTHTEFFMKVDPSHSLGYLKGRTFHVKHPDEAFPDKVVLDPTAPNPAEPFRRQAAANTINMLANLHRVTTMVAGQLQASYVYAAALLKGFVTPTNQNGKHP